MDIIITDVYEKMNSKITKDIKPEELIKIGVDALAQKHINKKFKREILVAIIQKVAYGRDKIANTEDDRLSENTLNLLILMIESELLTTVIDGVYFNFLKSHTRTIFKCCF